ncbi:MAG: hypothetical protein HW419_4515 [Deltaproteobacteria bacterium]|nr:hypothetical protein [Deltaproteobacteria bacterium]
MTSRLEDIARRKQALIDKAAGERADLARIYGELKSPLAIGSTLLGIGRALKTHPIVAAGVSSFLVSGYAGKLLKSTGELLKVWHLARPLWDWWRKRRSK